MLNRRQHPRIEYRERVEIKLYHVAGAPDLQNRVLEGGTSDISEGGVGLRLDRDLPSGTEVKLRIFVADPPSAFMHRGFVRWTRKEPADAHYLVGVEFDGGSPDHMADWRALVRHLIQRHEHR